MENNWEPRVGQKVVALVGASHDYIQKGNTYIVKEARKPCVCGFWVVDIGLIHEYEIGCRCETCGNKENTIIRYLLASYFAPIPEQYADMTSEIAQQFKEHPDTVDQPIKILETVN